MDGTLIHRSLAPRRRMYSFTYPGRMESWVSLGGKEGRTNRFKSWQMLELNWGPCGRKAVILPTAPATPTLSKSIESYSFYHYAWSLVARILHWKLCRLKLRLESKGFPINIDKTNIFMSGPILNSLCTSGKYPIAYTSHVQKGCWG